MFWVVQSNLYKEHNFVEIINLLGKLNIPHILVKPLPFTLKFASADTELNGQDYSLITEPYIDDNQPIMVCGAYTMSKIAKNRGWTPGAFMNENFEFDAWKRNWGSDNMLNGDAIVSTVEKIIIPEYWDKVFARPTEDTKSFSGGVFHREQFQNWMKDIQKIEGYSTLSSSTPILVSSVKEIYAEYRLFIIDNKIITGSLYKLRDQVIYNSLIDETVISFANKMIDKWQPDRAFVMDVAITPKGNKIIEINGINSAGFYASDLFKFVTSIEDMKF